MSLVNLLISFKMFYFIYFVIIGSCYSLLTENCDIRNFTYPCGKDNCNPFSQYCETSEGSLSYCAVCTPDICRGDPSEYPGCQLACNPSCHISPTSTTGPYGTTTSREQSTVVTSTSISAESQVTDSYANRWIFGLVLAASFTCNIVQLIVCCIQRKGKKTKAESFKKVSTKSKTSNDSGVDSRNNSPNQARKGECTGVNDATSQTETEPKTANPTIVSIPVNGVQESTHTVAVTGSKIALHGPCD